MNGFWAGLLNYHPAKSNLFKVANLFPQLSVLHLQFFEGFKDKHQKVPCQLFK